MEAFLQINEKDNVAIAIKTLYKGDLIAYKENTYTLYSDIPQGHKVAIKDILKDELIYKWGYAIGRASEDIPCGAHVHTFNCKPLSTNDDNYSYDEELAKAYFKKHIELNQRWENKIPTIMAYERANNEVGIRNSLWIIQTSDSLSSKCNELKAYADEFLKIKDGVYIISYPYKGLYEEYSNRVLSSFIIHPNAGGVIVVAKDDDTLLKIKSTISNYDESRVKLITQKSRNSIALLKELSEKISQDRRVPVSLNRLRIGLKCGSTDGFIGITANPLIGLFCEEFSAMGGSAIISEIPEILGSEQQLLSRAINRDIFDKIVEKLIACKEKINKHYKELHEEASMQNRAGGITTLEEKSISSIQKGGSAPVCDIIDFGERIKSRGLNILMGPGDNIISTAVQAAAGAHLILFSTGSGDPLSSPIPIIKIASNKDISQTKSDWIDFDSSSCLTTHIRTVASALLRCIVDVASGYEYTKNEINK